MDEGKLHYEIDLNNKRIDNSFVIMQEKMERLEYRLGFRIEYGLKRIEELLEKNQERLNLLENKK